MSTSMDLQSPVQYLSGVGPARAELLKKLGLRKAVDLVFNFPRDYEDTTKLLHVNQLEQNVPASVRGIVQEIDGYSAGSGKEVVGLLIKDGNDFIRAIWFNQPYRKAFAKVGETVVISGTPKKRGFRWEMSHPRVTKVETEDSDHTGKLLSIYRLTKGISQSDMRKITSRAIERYADQLPEVFPKEFLDQTETAPIAQAIRSIHSPSTPEELATARHRFVFQELLTLQLALQMRKARVAERSAAPKMEVSSKVIARIDRVFPFEMTDCQKKAFEEISEDLQRDFPMNRLLQGDVGSGKTAVALATMLVAVANGSQSALMAPTELLARQHFQTISKMLAGSRVRIALVTGSNTAKERRELVEKIKSHEIDFVIGTHAILNKDIAFEKLGLVIIDEQHRFGVHQRATIKQSGVDPHYLVMTATPIPRSISMTMFGDLEVTTLRSAPANRQSVNTYFCEEPQRDEWWEFVRKKLREGRQAFVITPRVSRDTGKVDEPEDDSTDEAFSEVDQALREILGGEDSLEQASVNSVYESLANGELEEFRLDVLYGGQTPIEKQQAMQRFVDGETQVLISTSVVEVGIDIPNASVMTIESAERFGLAQLHQFRGRVGRGRHAGFVGIFANPKNEMSRNRLQAFVDSNDGFELAETDFQLRGPGDIFGTQQHGMPPLRIADLRRDHEILLKAREFAERMIFTKALAQPEFSRLRTMIIKRYGEALGLSDVG